MEHVLKGVCVRVHVHVRILPCVCVHVYMRVSAHNSLLNHTKLICKIGFFSDLTCRESQFQNELCQLEKGFTHRFHLKNITQCKPPPSVLRIYTHITCSSYVWKYIRTSVHQPCTCFPARQACGNGQVYTVLRGLLSSCGYRISRSPQDRVATTPSARPHLVVRACLLIREYRCVTNMWQNKNQICWNCNAASPLPCSES